MTKKIKLLVFANYVDGGTGTFISALQQMTTSNKNIIVKIVSLKKPSFRQTSLNKINYFPKSVDEEKYRFSLTIFFNLLREILWLKNIVNNFQPSIILSVDSHCLLIAQITRLISLQSLKLIATVHNNLEEVINYKIQKPLMGLTKNIIGYSLKKADKVICVSKGLANHLYEFFKLKNSPLYIYCGLNSFYLDNQSQKLKEFNQLPTKTILVISRLFPQKDIRTIIKAFALVKSQIPESKLWIVGDGPLKPNLKATVKHLMLKDIKFFGWVENPIELMKKSDIFVFSSRWEGFGYTIIEAMSQGLPIIATDTPFGPREILKNGKYGKLIPMANHEEMAKAIYEILTDKKQYEFYSRKSIERAQDFTSNKMIKKYKKIFEELISKSSL